MRQVEAKSAVILDRHPLWLDAMSKLLAGVGVEVVAKTTDCNKAVTLVGEHQPDVLVAGVDPEDADQLMCIQATTESHPGTKTIVVADKSDPRVVEAVFAAGAAVYCIKTAEQQDLASAVRQTFERSIYIASDSALVAELRDRVPVRDTDRHGLTKRELEILRLVSEGHSNSQLARMLWVTEQTVKFHLSNIYRKLRVANRTEASRWAQVNGLLSGDREELEGASAVA